MTCGAPSAGRKEHERQSPVWRKALFRAHLGGQPHEGGTPPPAAGKRRRPPRHAHARHRDCHRAEVGDLNAVEVGRRQGAPLRPIEALLAPPQQRATRLRASVRQRLPGPPITLGKACMPHRGTRASRRRRKASRSRPSASRRVKQCGLTTCGVGASN